MYSYEEIISNFPELTLQEFALIPDDSTDMGLVVNPDIAFVDRQEYGCGCFWFRKN